MSFDLDDFLAPLISWAPLVALMIGTAQGALLRRAGYRLTRVHFIWSIGGAMAFFVGIAFLRAAEGSTVWERVLATLPLWLIFEAGLALGQRLHKRAT